MGLLVTGDGCGLSLEDLLNVQSQTNASRRSQPAKSRAQCAANGTKASILAEAGTVEDQKLKVTKDDSLELPDADDVDAIENDGDNLELSIAGDQFLKGFGQVLTRWVEATATVPQDRNRRVTYFHSVRPPSLAIQDYLSRIRKYFCASDECYVLALVYIDRVGKIDPAMTVCELNVHRLLVITAMLAAKFHDDVYYSNNYYAKVGGLSLKEVNALEAKFLKMLDWKLYVTPSEYQLYHSLVCQATFVEPEPEP